MYNTKNINILLVFLVLLDLFLSGISLYSPEMWTNLMHGTTYDDPAGLIRRMGAVWLAFLLFQFIALIRWQKQPYWLVLVAGIRLTEIFSDWFYWFYAEQLSWFGNMGLVIAPPSNLIFGLYLLKAFKKYNAPPEQQ
jgi:hypothetical protein